MRFLYETHLHTSYASACAYSRGSEYIQRYKAMGYSGLIVTDHFYNGNTAISRDLPWKEWVTQFCRGYEEARNEGERQGFDVLFGWEETFDNCDDYLVYGLDKAWLLEHPEVRTWTRGEQYCAVKEAGGCVVQAHPFRQHNYVQRIILSTGCVDAVEVANAGNSEQSFDALAMHYAHTLNLPVTAGSDMHDVRLMDEGGIFGIFTEERLNTIADFVRIVCNKGISGINVCEGRCNYDGNEIMRVPVEIRDRNDRSTGQSLKDFFSRSGI